MKPDCILAVGQVLGRQPTEADLRNVETRLSRTLRNAAAKDPQAWLALTDGEKLRQGAALAAQDVLGEAQLKQQRQVQQIIATVRVQGAIASFPGTPFEALNRIVAFHSDHKGSQLSIESQSRAIERDALRSMIDTLEATSPTFFGLIEDRAGLRDLVRELHGEATGNKDAAAGAKAFKATAEALRVRFNAAGGDVGHLEDWGMPHHHAQHLVAKAGKDGWIADTLPKLDRARYLTEAGRPMSDAEVTAFLGEAWTSIATGGVNKLQPGLPAGRGMRANRGNESRQVHFKDADAFLDYQSKYGERTPYDVLIGHISGVSKDIALTETLGPNPDQTFRMFRDRALQTMTLGDPVNAGAHNKAALNAENLYSAVAGKTSPVASLPMARFFDGLRNVLVASRLGSAVLTAIADEGTMRVSAHVNNLPEMRLVANELAALNPANAMEKRMAHRAGLALNTLTASLNRFGNDQLGSGWSSKIASATLRASGLNAMTDARRRAFGVTFMHALGQLAKDHGKLADLDLHDNRILLSKGITDADFEAWKLAELEDWGDGNSTMLTPESIARIPDAKLAHLGDPRQVREQAITKLLGTVLEETDVAVIEPGARERAMMMSHLQRGTLKGELTRSFFLFKSFPLAMVTKQWARGMAEPNLGGRVGYLASLFAATTVLGMVALQAQQVVSGKDPRDMTKGRTWMAGILRGGALSIFGDFLFSDSTQHGQSLLATVAGPVAGLTEDVFKLTQGNIVQAMQGQDTDAGAEAVKFARSNIPGANLWYAKAAIDHLAFHQLQEYLSPGYLRRMRDRAKKDYDQSFWWEPGQETPERAPDMAAAVGDNNAR